MFQKKDITILVICVALAIGALAFLKYQTFFEIPLLVERLIVIVVFFSGTAVLSYINKK